MKRLAAVIALVLALCVTACGADDPEAKRYAFVTDTAGADASTLSSQTWNGLTEAAAAKPCAATQYVPEEDSEEGYAAQYKAAVKDGAKLVVSAGSAMEDRLKDGAASHKKVSFALIRDDALASDASGKPESIGKNVCIVKIAAQDAGYLAGYALVMDGRTRLGFMGGERTTDAAYASGFLQGAERAASEKALAQGAVTVRMTFTGSNKLMPTQMETAVSWYDDGTEVICAPQAGVRKAVVKAAENAENVYVTASGTEDVTAESERILLTTVLDYSTCVKDIASAFEDDAFEGGSEVYYGVLDGCVRLSCDYAKMTGFSDTAYSLIVSNLTGGQARITRNEQLSSQMISVNME